MFVVASVCRLVVVTCPGSRCWVRVLVGRLSRGVRPGIDLSVRQPAISRRARAGMEGWGRVHLVGEGFVEVSFYGTLII